MMKRSCILLLILFLAGCSSEAYDSNAMADAGLLKIGTATYNGKDYSLIYEKNQDLIWLDYSSRRAGGWENSIKWASGLNASGVLTYEFNPGITVTWKGDWRLPETVDGKRKWGNDGTTTAGYNITTSEMGHLYYVSLGNLGRCDTKGNLRSGWGDDAAWGLKNKGPFNMLYPDTYWSSTDYSAQNEHAWAFSFAFGSQGNGTWKIHYVNSAIAVRPCKVVSAPVR